MSIRIFPDLVQGSPEWLEARRGMVTSSEVGSLVTAKTLKVAANETSRALALLLVAERITGWIDPVYVGGDMIRGTLDEPVARDWYSERYAPVSEAGFIVRDDWGFSIGYSPDGLVDGGGLIEVKSRRAKKHLATILADEVPAENVAQIQCGLLVSGRSWCDYVSWCGGMPMWTKRVFPDPAWQDAIVEAVSAFEATAAEMVTAYHRAVEGLPLTERTFYDLEMVI